MPRDDDTIGFEQLGIADVLKRYRLRVPPNQRDYAWTQSQVQNLLGDITLALELDEPQHFLGSIVTIRGDNNELEVVDGQQRLATVALILASMRAIVGDSKNNLSRLIDGFLSSIDSNTLEERPNIVLNSADASIFEGLVVNGKPGNGYIHGRDSHKLLVDAYKLCENHLKQVIAPFPENEKLVAFQRWIQYLQSYAKVILLIVSDAANSYKMFETLNDRGLRVSQTDLIKNYIFGQSGKAIESSQERWASIRGTLEALDDDDAMINFIRHSLIVTDGFLQQKEVYDNIQRKTKGSQSSVSIPANWDALSNEYIALSNADSSYWSEYPSRIRDNIRVLNLFDIAPFKPLLMAISQKMSKKEAALSFEKVVSIGVRLIIASRTTSQSVEKPLGDTANRIWNGDIKDAQSMISSLSQSIPNDRQFSDTFETATVSKPKFARYYLRSLERVASGEPEPWLIPNDDATVITLEHVVPQKPEGNWPSWTDEDVKTYLKRIGNLSLLPAKNNSGFKSIAFKDKKDFFRKAPYKTTSMIGEKEDWLPKDVVDRQKYLACLAVKAWPLK